MSDDQRREEIAEHVRLLSLDLDRIEGSVFDARIELRKLLDQYRLDEYRRRQDEKEGDA